MSGINQAIIIASGHNTSLVQLTRDRPKAMLPVLGKPLVIRLMERMREAGVQHFIVVVGEDEGTVASYFNNGWVPDAKINIVLQPMRRGPADALACASSYINGPFLVASCDHLPPSGHIANLIDCFQATDADVTLSAVATPSTGHLPTISVDGDWVTGIAPAPSKEYQPLSAFLTYACGKRFLNHIGARDDNEMTPAIQSLLTSGGSASYATAESDTALINEIDLLSINRRYLKEGRDNNILSEIPSSARITPPVRIDPQVSVGPNTKIGPNVYLESGSQIGPDAILWDAVVLSNAAVPPKEVLHHQIVLRRSRIIEAQPESEKTLPKKPKWDIEAMKKTRDES